jgi:hypothetical protein
VYYAFAPTTSNLPAFATPTTDAVLRLTTAIRFITAKKARFAEHPTCVAVPQAGNTAWHANNADIPPTLPAAIPCTNNRIDAIFDAANTASAAITANAACAAITVSAAIISTADTAESALSSRLDLCKRCRKHYHDRIYYHCWFCNFKW